MNLNLHELSCLIKHDIVGGILTKWKKTIPFLLIICGFSIYFAVQCSILKRDGLVIGSHSAADLLLYIFRGMREYVPQADINFEIPITWLMVQLYIAYAIGNYASEDQGIYGQHFIVRSTKKSFWFISKCIYCSLTVIIYYALAYFIIILCTLITGNLTFRFSLDICSIMSEIDSSLITSDKAIIHLIILPILTSLVLSLGQMVLSLYIKPILSFVFVVAYCSLSAYFESPLLIGNNSMILRFDPFLEEGLNPGFAIFSDLIIIALVIILGCMLLKKHNYLDNN